MVGKPSDYGTAVARYGRIDLIHKVWPQELKWMTRFNVPAALQGGWLNTASAKPTTRIYCNRDMVPALSQALRNVLDAGLRHELKTYDGCFAVRSVRGKEGKVSTHSYGLALDINAFENGLNETPKLSPLFVTCWTDAGFDWGGHFSRVDGMHFSWAWEGQ